MSEDVKLPEPLETALNEAVDAVADETRREGAGYSERQFREAIDNTQATIGTLRAEIAALVAERDEARGKLARIEAQEPVAWAVYNVRGDVDCMGTDFAHMASMAQQWDKEYPISAPHRVVALYEREVGG